MLNGDFEPWFKTLVLKHQTNQKNTFTDHKKNSVKLHADLSCNRLTYQRRKEYI
jgi:hypothetical protein